MATATYNGTSVAEENDKKKLVHLEGNVYFHTDSVNMSLLTESTHTSICPSKGKCNYYDVKVGDKTARNGAWVYRTPNGPYSNIKDRLAFWNGVNVQESGDAGAGGDAMGGKGGKACCVIQ